MFSGSAGKNRKPPSTPGFLPTKPQVADAQNRGVVDSSLFFTALPEPLDGSMRQISELSSTPPFSRNETAGRSFVTIQCGRNVWNLPHTTGLSGSLSRFSWFGLALVT